MFTAITASAIVTRLLYALNLQRIPTYDYFSEEYKRSRIRQKAMDVIDDRLTNGVGDEKLKTALHILYNERPE